MDKIQQQMKSKKFTPSRKAILHAFILHDDSKSGKYGRVASNEWINELIYRLKVHNHRTGKVTISDVKAWLQAPEFIVLLEAVQTSTLASTTGSSTTKAPESPAHTQVSSSSFIWPHDANTLKYRDDGAVDYKDSNNKILESSQTNTTSSETIGVPKATTVSQSEPEVSSSSFTPSQKDSAQINFDGNDADGNNADGNDADEMMDLDKPAADTQTLPKDSIKQEPQTDAPQSEIIMHIKQTGFVIHMPPRSTTTTVYIEPNGWKAYKHHSDATDFSTFIPPDAEQVDIVYMQEMEEDMDNFQNI